jgi:D-glycero-D-manno-heptose 1,7-bisphosphate phosphatase
MLTTKIILMVGLPASGKSLLTNEYEKLGYTTLSLDKKTMFSATDTAALDKELKRSDKVIIDNTNTTLVTRKKFIDYAKNNNLTIGAHYINTSKDDCLINSLHRMYEKHGEVFMHLSDVPANLKKESNLFVISAIFSMVKYFDKVSKLEGFDQVETTKFVRTDNFGYTNKAIFVDLDGTVRQSNGVEPYPTELEDIEILKNSAEILSKYKSEGYKIIAVTNQSGVRKGTLTTKKVIELIEHTNKLLGGVIDDYHFCPHLPPKDICYCRKPQSGIGVAMMHKHKLDLKSCVMVGDATSDKTFAERLKITFRRPNMFFER